MAAAISVLGHPCKGIVYDIALTVTPAKAGVHEHPSRKHWRGLCSWMPAFAGMTKWER